MSTPHVPPFTVRAQTDNLRNCKLVVTDAEGASREFVTSSDGNVYQGLHAIKGDLEEFLNEVVGLTDALAKRGPAPAPTVDELPATEPEPQA